MYNLDSNFGVILVRFCSLRAGNQIRANENAEQIRIMDTTDEFPKGRNSCLVLRLQDSDQFLFVIQTNCKHFYRFSGQYINSCCLTLSLICTLRLETSQPRPSQPGLAKRARKPRRSWHGCLDYSVSELPLNPSQGLGVWSRDSWRGKQSELERYHAWLPPALPYGLGLGLLLVNRLLQIPSLQIDQIPSQLLLMNRLLQIPSISLGASTCSFSFRFWCAKVLMRQSGACQNAAGWATLQRVAWIPLSGSWCW